jgi:hypothetical protein
MGVHDFDIICTIVFPMKTDAPLIIDTNTVLPLSVATQLFQPVTRRRQQISQILGIM